MVIVIRKYFQEKVSNSVSSHKVWKSALSVATKMLYDRQPQNLSGMQEAFTAHTSWDQWGAARWLCQFWLGLLRAGWLLIRLALTIVNLCSSHLWSCSRLFWAWSHGEGRGTRKEPQKSGSPVFAKVQIQTGTGCAWKRWRTGASYAIHHEVRVGTWQERKLVNSLLLITST